jgi:hypothetical protein
MSPISYISQVSDKPLDAAVKVIEQSFADMDRACDHARLSRIRVGQMLIELRRRVDNGEAGEGVHWWSWYQEHFTRSRKDAEKIMRMVAGGPEHAIERHEREKAALRETHSSERHL